MEDNSDQLREKQEKIRLDIKDTVRKVLEEKEGDRG